ncbi:MAG: hypothetical protein LPK88_01780 [Alphaproteobacteria bacterium]|nr:hypothetical protein [Alphaproteobacteria bacterium]MDX5415037.1 hypothetical protein [Alphaproteobacteria bacterium]MDX5492222.1 hypothetical protein [Alphaproteobacteria bacterium]
MIYRSERRRPAHHIEAFDHERYSQEAWNGGGGAQQDGISPGRNGDGSRSNRNPGRGGHPEKDSCEKARSEETGSKEGSHQKGSTEKGRREKAGGKEEGVEALA